MKIILRVLFFVFISAKLFAQNPIAANKLIYLDSIWVPSNPENYKYTRLIEEYYSDKKSYIYKDYYKSGAIKYIATTLDKDIILNDGQTVSYYENGNKKSTVTYAKTKKTGTEFNWYENGELKSDIVYSQDKKGKTQQKINNFWNPQKERIVTDGNGYYEDKSKNSEESGQIKNGEPHGIWKGKDFTKKTIE